MARNASGTYARVVDDYVDGGVIRADDHNDEHDDFGAEITDSLNRSGKGGMLTGLKLVNGLVGAPAFYFAGGTTTGMYLNAAGDLRLALAAADIQSWTAALVRIETHLLIDGNIEANAAAFTGTMDMNGAKIQDLGTPSSSTDAATKGYVDGLLDGTRTAVGSGGGAPAFENTWANFTGSRKLTYWKDGFGNVSIEGYIQDPDGGAADHNLATIFTLPAGYRPTGIVRSVCSMTDGPGYISVGADGVLTPTKFTGAGNLFWAYVDIHFNLNIAVA